MDLYQKALTSSGQSYLEDERQLLAQGEQAAAFLSERLKDAPPLAKLVAQAILGRLRRDPEFEECLKFIDDTEQRAQRSVMGAPPPEYVAAALFHKFGNRVSPLLGVQLLKLQEIWPHWKTLATLLYLGKLESASAADVLICFVASTTDDHQRNLAIRSLVAVGDANVLAKIEAEPKTTDEARAALNEAASRIRESLKREA
jgi:hypothetical protein